MFEELNEERINEIIEEEIMERHEYIDETILKTMHIDTHEYKMKSSGLRGGVYVLEVLFKSGMKVTIEIPRERYNELEKAAREFVAINNR